MRIRVNSFLSLGLLIAFGAVLVGCKTGTTWNKPNTWGFKSFSKKGSVESQYGQEEHIASARPSDGAMPNISTPPGGYSADNRQVARTGYGTDPFAPASQPAAYSNTQYPAASPNASASYATQYPQNNAPAAGYTQYPQNTNPQRVAAQPTNNVPQSYTQPNYSQPNQPYPQSSPVPANSQPYTQNPPYFETAPAASPQQQPAATANRGYDSFDTYDSGRFQPGSTSGGYGTY